MKNQKIRSMKVHEQSGYNYKATPTIILKGQWLKEMGFEIGDYITVSCEEGKLIITPDAENPFCVKCYEEGHITMATVVDHIVPHRGDQKLFWDRGNWQPLCEHHHNVKTMTEDRYVEYKF